MRTGRRKEKRERSPGNSEMKELWVSLLVGDKSFVLLFLSPACDTGCCCPETGKYCPPPPFFRDHFGRATDVPISTPFPPAAATATSPKSDEATTAATAKKKKKKKLSLRFHLRPGLSVLLAPRSPGIEWRPGRRKEHKTDGPRFPTREILARSEKKGPHLQAKGQGAEIKENLFFCFAQAKVEHTMCSRS